MFRDREKIEADLKIGKKILEEKPELMDMPRADVLEYLNDGSPEMIHNRWGAVAYLYTNDLKSLDLDSLVDSLSAIKSGVPTYDYVGYILQTEYQVDLTALLLKANEMGKFNDIVAFVTDNIRFQPEFQAEQVKRCVDMAEEHKDNRYYHNLLQNYADYIVEQHAWRRTEEALGEIDNRSKYYLMYQMGWQIYQEDREDADAIAERMFGKQQEWSRKLAVAYLEMSVNYGPETFDAHFHQVEHYIEESRELWCLLIPAFVKYYMAGYPGEIRKHVLEHLSRIPEGEPEGKMPFLEQFQRDADMPEELMQIFHAVLEMSFQKDPRVLDLLDYCFYRQMEKGRINEVLSDIKRVFVANDYRTKYQEFFEALNCTGNEFAKYKETVLMEAFDSILAGEEAQFFFGLGLLDEMAALLDMEPENLPYAFTGQQLVLIIEGMLYFLFDATKVCRMAFWLAHFASEQDEAYMEKCVEEVYPNYPYTMNSMAEAHVHDASWGKAELAQRVLKAHLQRTEKRMQGYEIADLRPSREREYIYHIAEVEQNRKIQKLSKQKSVFANLFKNQVLKYGKRMAHVIEDSKGELYYQVNPFQEIKFEMEMPTVFLADQLLLSACRIEYLKRMGNHETDY